MLEQTIDIIGIQAHRIVRSQWITDNMPAFWNETQAIIGKVGPLIIKSESAQDMNQYKINKQQEDPAWTEFGPS